MNDKKQTRIFEGKWEQKQVLANITQQRHIAQCVTKDFSYCHGEARILELIYIFEHESTKHSAIGLDENFKTSCSTKVKHKNLKVSSKFRLFQSRALRYTHQSTSKDQPTTLELSNVTATPFIRSESLQRIYDYLYKH